MQPFVTTVVTTISGSAQTVGISTSRTVAVTTGVATFTSSPSLNSSGGGSGSGGLSSSTKKVIGGVVGGVGGAILLGGIALVAWRMWGKKRSRPEYDDDFLAGGPDSLQREKHASQGGATPFQTTLDQYHTPGSRPNAAANF